MINKKYKKKYKNIKIKNYNDDLYINSIINKNDVIFIKKNLKNKYNIEIINNDILINIDNIYNFKNLNNNKKTIYITNTIENIELIKNKFHKIIFLANLENLLNIQLLANKLIEYEKESITCKTIQ